MITKKRLYQLPKKRKLRKDTRIKAVRQFLGLSKEAVRNPDGSIARGNKKLETLRLEYYNL